MDFKITETILGRKVTGYHFSLKAKSFIEFLIHVLVIVQYLIYFIIPYACLGYRTVFDFLLRNSKKIYLIYHKNIKLVLNLTKYQYNRFI
jgi:hypothetical protein